MNTSNKLLIVVLILTFGAKYNQVYGQVPQGINFQAMARQADGRPIANKQVSVRISIANESATGNKEYVEQHFPTTNALGLFDLVIGKGNLVSGSFAAITWANGHKWIQVELDPNGANNFILMGAQQMMSVPYSIYADIAGNVINYKSGKGISINGEEISNTGDDDNDSTNELVYSFELDNDNILRLQDAGGVKEIDLNKFDNQPLSLGDVLTIGTDAANKRISNLANPENDLDAATKIYVDNLDIKDEDADPTNEIQDLELTSNILKITLNESATAIDLSAYLDNTDNQSLSLTGTEISISGGNTIDIISINTDNQTLTLTEDVLNISGGNSVDLSLYLDNTDNQSLELNGTVLSISGGNQIDINEINTDNQNLSLLVSGTNRTINIDNGVGIDFSVADNDNDATNELQNLNISADMLSITNGNSVSLSAYRQNLNNAVSGTNRTITISGGVSTTISVADNDNDPTNELQNLSQVLSRNNDAGGIPIRNLGFSNQPNDAATVGYVDQKFSGITTSAQMSVNSGDELITSTTATNNHYAFKVSTAFSGVGINSLVSLTRNASGFDEANSINQNRFVAAENGIYQFTINASSSDASATLKVSINGNIMGNIMKVNAGLFQETLMFKLNTNDYLEIRIDQGTAATLTGSFHGFKL
jgi:hypothetical protein